jgi:hypothetical protein
MESRLVFVFNAFDEARRLAGADLCCRRAVSEIFGPELSGPEI